MGADTVPECGTGQSKIFLQSLIFFLFSAFVSPPLGLTLLTAQGIKISMKLKEKRAKR